MHEFHVRPGTGPLWQQILLDLLAPPMLTALWWLMSKALAASLGTSESTTVQGWLSSGIWILLIGLYVTVILVSVYAWFF